MHKQDRSDEEWARQSGELLRQAEQQMDAEMAARLQAARLTAIEHAGQPPALQRWLPAVVGSAAAVAAVVFTVLLYSPQMHSPGALPMMDETEMAAAQETELLENLEFLAWMMENDEGVQNDAEPVQG